MNSLFPGSWRISLWRDMNFASFKMIMWFFFFFNEKELKEERTYSGWWFECLVHHGREGMEALSVIICGWKCWVWAAMVGSTECEHPRLGALSVRSHGWKHLSASIGDWKLRLSSRDWKRWVWTLIVREMLSFLFPFFPFSASPGSHCGMVPPTFSQVFSPQLNLPGNSLTDRPRWPSMVIPNPVRLKIKINHRNSWTNIVSLSQVHHFVQLLHFAWTVTIPITIVIGFLKVN